MNIIIAATEEEEQAFMEKCRKLRCRDSRDKDKCPFSSSRICPGNADWIRPRDASGHPEPERGTG